MENLELYDKVRAVPDNAKKTISAGRLKGMTDINPMWRIKCLTENFGICGIGWKTQIVRTWIDVGYGGEAITNVEILLFVKVDGAWSEGIPGVGGSRFIAKETGGLYTDDECYKKAYTDATALEAIRQAVYTTGDEMNAFVEQYRGKVNDEQFNALMQEGVNRANVNAENKRIEDQSRLESEQATAFRSAEEDIINSGISNQADMDAFIEQYRGKVSDSQFASLQSKGKSVVNGNITSNYDTHLGTVEQGVYNMLAEPSNFTSDGTKLTEAGRKKILDYIEQNKGVIGDAHYGTLKGQIEAMAYYSNSERNSALQTAISNFSSNTNFNSQLSQVAEALSLLESHRGSMTTEEYNQFLSQINAGTRTDYTTYYVQGLGSGRNNDDIDITIGSTSRNRDTEYDLLCGDEVTNDAAKKLLNRLTTGTESVTPEEGRLCVVANRMYIYTSKGWRNVKNDNSDSALSNAISAFLRTGKSTGGGGSSGGSVSYPSDSEIANKAQSGTLTYNDVAKYNPGIRTLSEFNRGNNSDKQTYGTYQNYLKAMYEKYKN